MAFSALVFPAFLSTSSLLQTRVASAQRMLTWRINANVETHADNVEGDEDNVRAQVFNTSFPLSSAIEKRWFILFAATIAAGLPPFMVAVLLFLDAIVSFMAAALLIFGRNCVVYGCSAANFWAQLCRLWMQ
eukprot:3188446-Rhodomonas_salina.1